MIFEYMRLVHDMNVDLGQPIAYGRTAEIYAWQEGQVLKLFYELCLHILRFSCY